MSFIKQKKNKQKLIDFVLTLGKSQGAKNALKLSSKYLEDRICKIKQYLNYIRTIINQNILAILRAFLNLEKKCEKSQTKQITAAATTECLRKVTNRKKISYKHFNLCEAEISLDEIIKSKNSEQIINLQQNRRPNSRIL